MNRDSKSLEVTGHLPFVTPEVFQTKKPKSRFGFCTGDSVPLKSRFRTGPEQHYQGVSGSHTKSGGCGVGRSLAHAIRSDLNASGCELQELLNQICINVDLRQITLACQTLFMRTQSPERSLR